MSSSDQIPQYKLGDSLITTGEAIVHVAGQTNRVGVYVVNGNRIRWEWYESAILPSELHRANSRLEDIFFRIGATIPESKRAALISQAAGALFSALNANDGTLDPHFRAISAQLAFSSNANQSFRYLTGAALGLGIVALAAMALSSWTTVPTPILIGIAAGAFGALLSVLQRIRDLGLSRYAHLWYSFFQGLARSLLGVFFGLFFVFANQGEIILSAYKSNYWAMAAFAALAGVSERFIPELIKRLESGSENAAKAKAE